MRIIWPQNSTSENVFQENNLNSATIYPLIYVKKKSVACNSEKLEITELSSSSEIPERI